MNEHAISALLARATQAEQALDNALAGHDITIEIAHGLKEQLAQAEQQRDAALATVFTERQRHQLRVAERDRLRTVLEDAIECVESWGAYAEDYFKEKWDLEGDLARLRAALGSTTEPQQAALTMAVVEEAAYATAAVYVDGDGESAAWMVRDLIVLAGSTTEPEETRAALIEAGESLDLTGRVLDFEIVAEPEETHDNAAWYAETGQLPEEAE